MAASTATKGAPKKRGPGKPRSRPAVQPEAPGPVLAQVAAEEARETRRTARQQAHIDALFRMAEKDRLRQKALDDDAAARAARNAEDERHKAAEAAINQAARDAETARRKQEAEDRAEARFGGQARMESNRAREARRNRRLAAAIDSARREEAEYHRERDQALRGAIHMRQQQAHDEARQIEEGLRASARVRQAEIASADARYSAFVRENTARRRLRAQERLARWDRVRQFAATPRGVGGSTGSVEGDLAIAGSISAVGLGVTLLSPRDTGTDVLSAGVQMVAGLVGAYQGKGVVRLSGGLLAGSQGAYLLARLFFIR